MKGIIGTGGHIDHGKTALVRALTGQDTDRLPEEQRRGISIDLGFTRLTLDDRQLGIVDVPGHEDFIRNMLAGATGIDLLLLVIAADEGVMPQTREHAAIAELLGVDRAVVALTKVDLVNDDWLGLAHDDVADFLAATPFAGAPVVPTSAETGQGLDGLRTAIRDVFRGTRGRPDDLFRLPIDRAFTVRGTGTVVTGTVWSGRLSGDATIRLLPDGPEARVRGLQVHGGDVDAIEAGERAAVALTGVDRDDVARGMTLVAAEGWEPAHILTARLRVLPGTDWSIEDGQRVRVHLGTAEVMARAVLLDRDRPLLPGDQGWAQLRLEAALLARAGDRAVIRSYSPVTTIAGALVAEPAAPRRTALRPADADLLARLADGPHADALAALLEAAGERGVPIAPLPALTGATPADAEAALNAAIRAGGRAFHPGALDRVRDRLVEAVDSHHQRHHLEPGIEQEAARRACSPAHPALVEHALDRLLEEDALVSRGGRLARAGREITLSAEEQALRDRIARTLADAGHEPPRLDELAEALGRPPALEPLVRLLEDEGRLVRLDHDLYVDADTMQRTIAAVRTRFGGHEGLSPADFRDIVDVSRKHLMPLLAYLDGAGVTVRSGEGRTVPA